MFRKSIWGLGDQAINSLSSLVLAVMVARESTPEHVGAWAIGYAVYTFVLTITRSSISTTAIISVEGVTVGESSDVRRNPSDIQAVSAAVHSALIVTLLSVPAGLLLGGILGSYLVIFGLAIPFLIWQDSMRYVTIRRGRLRQTTIVDFVWLGLQILFGLGLYAAVEDGRMITVGWVLASVVSIGVASFFVSPILKFGAAKDFVRIHRTTIGALLAESSLAAGIANLQPAVLGLVIGLAATGYFRGALSLLGVAGAVVMGLTPIATVEAVRLIREGRSVSGLLWTWIAGIAVLGGGVTVVVGLIPDSWGAALLGETWYGAASIFPVLAMQIVFRGPNSGIPLVLRAGRQLKAVVWLRVVHSVSTLAITTGGAVLYGLKGAAWGWLLSSMLLCVFSTLVYMRLRGQLNGVGRG